jgi:excisionase family DNA binding protein
MEIKFEDLPRAISQLLNEFEIIKNFLSQEKPKAKTENSDILSVKEAAKFLKLHPITIYNKINNGSLPATKRGKQWYLFEDELMNYLKTGKRFAQQENVKSIDMYLESRKK